MFIHSNFVSKETARTFENIASIGWTFFSSFFLWFTLIFVRKTKILRTRLFYPLLFVLPAIFVYKQLTRSLVSGYVRQSYGWAPRWSGTIWPILFIIYYFSFIMLGLYLVFNFWQLTKEPLKRRQSGIIFNGALIALTLGSLTDVVLPMFNIYAVPDIGNVIALIWVLGILYAMAKYNFLHITPSIVAKEIISTLSDSLLIFDGKGMITDVNNATEKLSEYPKDELVARSGWLLFSKKDFDFLCKVVLKKTHIDNYELSLVTKAQKEIPVLFSATALRNKRQEIIGIVAIVKDITDRKKAEEITKRAYTELSQIFNTVTEGMCVINKEFEVIRANEAFTSFFGTQIEELVGKKCFEVLPDAKCKTSACPLMEILNGQPRVEYETEYRNKEGKVIWAAVSTFPFFGGGQEVIGAVKVFKDIAGRKEAEVQLKLAAEQWQVTFDSITELVSIVGKDYSLINVNKAFAESFSTIPQELVGKKCYEVMHSASDGPIDVCPHDITMQTRAPAVGEYYDRRLECEIEVSTSPMFDKHGVFIGSVHIAKKISHRKEIEKSQRLAQLGKLAADVAHEVNNPLMVISGRAQIALMEKIENLELRRNLDIVVDECQRAKGIVQRLLKFSRPTRREAKELDINKTLEEVIAIIAHQFKLSNVEIEKKFSEHLPAVMVDEKQIQEVIMNLLINAQDAMPQGGLVRITTGHCEGRVVIECADSGQGMSQEALANLFEPFFTTKEKGTGLGLSVCYGILKAYNGTLAFKSSLGEGTTAIVSLPAWRSRDSEAANG